MPSRNFEGLFNFKTGDGKSPSFFFFTDNNLLMLKTLKESEFNILMNRHEFLMDYFKYVTENPSCLLTKILGLFKIKMGNSTPIYYMIMENMIGNDKHKVIRNFDLKGSIFGRIEKISNEEMLNGSGLKCLKD